MPWEFAPYFHDLDFLAVKLRNNFGPPMLAHQLEFFLQHDLAHRQLPDGAPENSWPIFAWPGCPKSPSAQTARYAARWSFLFRLPSCECASGNVVLGAEASSFGVSSPALPWAGVMPPSASQSAPVT